LWKFGTGHHLFTGVVVFRSAKNRKGVGFIRKIQIITSIAIKVLGVAVLAASFFVLRGYHENLSALGGRVEDLEYDRLCEVYRQAGYEVD